MPRFLPRVVPLLLCTTTSENVPETCTADSDGSKGECGCSNLNRNSDGAAAELELFQASEVLSAKATSHNEEMVEIPPGMFHMGEVKERVVFPQDGEGPLRPARMSGFQLDKFEVSNAKFRDFVRDTGYVTEVERLGDSFVSDLFLSEQVLDTIDKKVDAVPWWLPVKNATWRTPEGFDSGLSPDKSRFGDRWSHPVVHVSWNDADAYCRWRNATLPTEAQWEYAARGGEQRILFPWGDEVYGEPKRWRLNIWQGKFPKENTAKDKWLKTAPVDFYGKQNEYGLYNMVGNVWEWTSDWFSPVHFLTEETQHTGLIDPQGPSEEELDQVVEMGYMQKSDDGQYEKVQKGGSFMCHKSYCYRYRIPSRHKLTVDSSAHHIGMRCARPPTDPEAAHWSKAAPLPAHSQKPSSLQDPAPDESTLPIIEDS